MRPPTSPRVILYSPPHAFSRTSSNGSGLHPRRSDDNTSAAGGGAGSGGSGRSSPREHGAPSMTCTCLGASVTCALPGCREGFGGALLPSVACSSSSPSFAAPPHPSRMRRFTALLIVTLLIVGLLQLLTLYRDPASSSLLSLRRSSAALVPMDPVAVSRLNSTLRYERTVSTHLRRVIQLECERQLRGFGWGDAQISSEESIIHTLGGSRPVAGDPLLTWTDEQRDNWHGMGCVNYILLPRALRDVEKHYEALLARQAESLKQRERARNATWGNDGGWTMQRGLYSGAYRRDGTCGRELRCVIAMSLYGSSPRYTTAILSSVRRMPRVFPGWELRVYYDHTVPAGILDKLLAHEALSSSSARAQAGPSIAKLQLVNVTREVWAADSPELARISGAFYRFLVADDPSVDRWVSRDCDALLLERDAAAVNEWINSGWTFHTMADFPQHGSMLAGMWGAVNYVRDNGTALVVAPDGSTTPKPRTATMIQDAFGGRSMRQLMEQYTAALLIHNQFNDKGNPKFYGVDQMFQIQWILPVLQKDYMGHDSYHCAETRNSFSFPVQRAEPYVFIGQTQTTAEDGSVEMDGDERTEPNYELSYKRPSPVECRRKPEWIYG